MASMWFVRGGGKIYGPLDAARLKRLADEGKIDQQTDVAINAAGPWHPAGNVRGLFAPPAAKAGGMQSGTADSATAATPNASSVPTNQTNRVARLAYPLAAILGCVALASWAALSLSGGATAIDARLAAAHPKAVARGLEDGDRAGRRWAGNEMPGDARLTAMAEAAAEDAIPSNVALVGSGSDEERKAYSQAFISKFATGFADEMPLKLKRARQQGEDDGHQAGFLWARFGKKEPDDERLTAAAEIKAEEVISSNAALVNAGSDQERREYVKGFVSQFPVGYRKAN